MTWECDNILYRGYDGYTRACDYENDDSTTVCAKCGAQRTYYCRDHGKVFHTGETCPVCSTIANLTSVLDTARSLCANWEQMLDYSSMKEAVNPVERIRGDMVRLAEAIEAYDKAHGINR